MNNRRLRVGRQAGLLLATALGLGACVQPAYDRTVVYEVDVSAMPNVQRVGVRGSDAPLSWNTDLPLTPRDSSGIYTATVTYRTGRLVTDVKFTVNGNFELVDRPNRTVRVPKTTVGGDTTVFRAIFDRP